HRPEEREQRAVHARGRAARRRVALVRGEGSRRIAGGERALRSAPRRHHGVRARAFHARGGIGPGPLRVSRTPSGAAGVDRARRGAVDVRAALADYRSPVGRRVRRRQLRRGDDEPLRRAHQTEDRRRVGAAMIRRRVERVRCFGVAAVIVLVVALSASAAAQGKKVDRDVLTDSPDTTTQLSQLMLALVRLPIATGLATVLAMRPRRRGTPRRTAAVIHTQIILAIVGALVMLVVGSSLARAFGIVGAAGLVRYRSKIEDPKDAGVMLSTLGIGLAAGVGVWMLAVFTTVFVLAVLWIVESFEPTATQSFALRVKAKDPSERKSDVERLLARSGATFEVRSLSKDELCYDVRLPLERKTDRLSERIAALDPESVSVVWEEKKEKKG